MDIRFMNLDHLNKIENFAYVYSLGSNMKCVFFIQQFWLTSYMKVWKIWFEKENKMK